MNCQNIGNVACVGAGVIGSSWASLFAGNGCNVAVHDVSSDALDQAKDRIHSFVQFLTGNQLVPVSSGEEALDRVTLTTELAEALNGVSFVQEAVRERLELKKKVFAELDRHSSEDALLASSSSGFSPTKIQSVVDHPERCFVAHPFNPPHLVPLVEIVPGEHTGDQVVEDAYDFYESIGKQPILIKKEITGYAVNRVQCALWREAIDLVTRGVVSVEDIDKGVRYGPGIRWAVVGPHMQNHLSATEGIEQFIEHYEGSYAEWWESLADWSSMPEGAKEKLSAGLEEELAGRDQEKVMEDRDQKIATILKILRKGGN